MLLLDIFRLLLLLALRVARGIAEGVTGQKCAPIDYVDTENRRALHDREAFPEMMHFEFQAVDENNNVIGFPPERWITVIDAAEAAKLPVLIIDSFSHAWEGVGGVLDMHAETLDRLTRGDDSKKDARSQLAWAQVKPRYRRLIDRIVRAKINIIIRTRAKPVMLDKNGRNARKTKTRDFDIPWDPASDGDLMFEMSAMMILDPSAPGCPVYRMKYADQFKALFDPKRPMTEDLGRQMAEWAQGQGKAQWRKERLDEFRDVARKGKAAIVALWGELDNADRLLFRTINDELQKLAEDADAGSDAIDTDDPFGLPDNMPSHEERALTEHEALKAIAESRAKEGVGH